jgi:hypothetical protein
VNRPAFRTMELVRSAVPLHNPCAYSHLDIQRDIN